MGYPTVFPTKTTIYKKDKALNGYTLFNTPIGAVLIDMNGREVHVWPDAKGFISKLLPNGELLCGGDDQFKEASNSIQMESPRLVQLNWDGEETWSFNRFEQLKTDLGQEYWSARVHHDFQREGNPVGYYTPDLAAKTYSGNTLLLCHRHIHNPKISDKCLLDDVFVEVDWQGNIVWEWAASDHFEALGFSDAARNVFFRNPNLTQTQYNFGDYLHINSMSRLGPNRHYENGHQTFHPENIIWSSREANIVAITCRQTGKIVWRLGPDYSEVNVKHFGWVIGQHHAHIIPLGLPGAGNILLFDNGWLAGYGLPTPTSSYGLKNADRGYSRILEFDPISLKIVWEHSANNLGYKMPMESYRFYSPYVSSAQRLLNGNTLITEGSGGRLIEVTKEHQIVWEYISPYQYKGYTWENMVYRAYRIPYEWFPQLEKPEEITLPDIDLAKFHIS